MSGICASAADSGAKPVLSFRLTATNSSFARSVGHGLTLQVERDVLGWEVGVFRKGSTDNLLYPQHNWHGAYPCQLYAWSHRTKTLPDEGIIPVRGVKQAVRVRLVAAAVAGDATSAKFTGGRVDIYVEGVP